MSVLQGMTETRPRFSIVSPVYNVEPYLADYIGSIESQRFDLAKVEVIAVDDGSTDGSLAVLQGWARRRPELVTVLTQPNSGPASARNLGLDHAHGEWVTFTDPDDMLDREFLAVADRFAREHPKVEMMAGKPLMLMELEERINDSHPRRGHYGGGDRPVDLEREPSVFAGVSAASILRLDRVREQGLRYDPLIRPAFEDGHFVASYLLSLRQPVIGVLRDAEYIYRKRARGDSALQRAWANPDRYDAVLRHGYLDLLERARATRGVIPEWLQHLVIYELSWYLSTADNPHSQVRIAPEMVPVFHDLLGQVLACLDPDVVYRHSARVLRPVWADVLAHAHRPGDWRSEVVTRTRVDDVMGLQRLQYRHVGRQPVDAYMVDGHPVEPVAAKTMAHFYFGRTLMEERIVWLPLGRGTTVTLDGIATKVLTGSATRAPQPAAHRDLRRALSAPVSGLIRPALRRARRLLTGLAASILRAVARTAPYRSTFGDAWVLVDRIYNADDNAERLFEHLRSKRPDINAWFVVEKGTPDWTRLRAAGVDRLVAYGSFRWKMMMLNCSWVVSSHVDRPITEPPALMWLIGDPTWRYAFIEHGVTKDDLSSWLNLREMDLFVVSTEAELESVVADGTSYTFTTKETRNTGLARFDRLLDKAREVPPDERDLVLIAPTWRSYLTAPAKPGTQRPVTDVFWDSDFVRNWMGVLRSPEIAEAAARRGWRVAFMPHPNFQPILGDMHLPPHVEPLTFTDHDVQALYARCALLVTDYSSVAFNIAYIDAPVVYFQFDQDDVFGGGHIGRKGYFEYPRDGFGPVAADLEAAQAAIVASIDRGPRPSPEYQARIDQAFPVRDGQACARVVAAIEEMSRPYVRPGAPAA